MVTKLIVASGKSAGRSISLKRDKLLIGRSEDCDVRPLSEEVSRRHCAITVGPADVWIEDLKSRNGTFVNGKRIEPENRIKLADGDMIRVGSLELRVARAAPAGGTPGSESQVSKWLSTEGSSVISHTDATASIAPTNDPTQSGLTQGGLTQTVSEDTINASSLSTIGREAGKASSEAPGSLPKSAIRKPDSSRDAAAEALKKFFDKK
jgi:pSer/pThr/pTyr-binding forkhead associated (FHA) protein